MAGYVLSASARRDLADIWAYTAERWSHDQADRYLRALTAGFEALASGDEDGRPADHIRAGYRRLLVGSHIVFFRRPGQPPLQVIRVLHRRMDWPSHLD